jgi:hypothetical protein
MQLVTLSAALLAVKHASAVTALLVTLMYIQLIVYRVSVVSMLITL